jgi:hypothetical protein
MQDGRCRIPKQAPLLKTPTRCHDENYFFTYTTAVPYSLCEKSYTLLFLTTEYRESNLLNSMEEYSTMDMAAVAL